MRGFNLDHGTDSASTSSCGPRRAGPTSLVNLSFGYRHGPFEIGATLLNALDARDPDVAYFYASRLAHEPAGAVTDVHSHPVASRNLRLSVRWGL